MEQTNETAQHISTEAEKALKVEFSFLNKLQLTLELSPNDGIYDVRSFLQEISMLNFFTNYHFECNSEKINEYITVQQLELPASPKIQILLDPFDEKSAKYHIKQLQKAIKSPKQLILYIGNLFQASKTGESVKQDGNADLKPSDKQQKQQKQLNFDQVLQPDLSSPILHLSQEKLTQFTQKLIDSLTYSGFNPPPSQRRLKGDLFYLQFRSLEGTTFHITACPLGFYLNRCSSRAFDPLPQINSQIHSNLIELLVELSPEMKARITELQKFHDQVEPEVNIPHCYKLGSQWLKTSPPNNGEHEWDIERCETFLLNSYGFDSSQIRDWNEELQLCRDLPRQDPVQRLNRDKALVKIHTDFIQAVIEGGKAVIEHNITALNPMDHITQQVFVYNGIFFSFATENIFSFKQETGADSSPTISSSNCDLRNLNILHRMNIPDLHVLNTVLLDYKGNRLIAQSIIPGILNSDHSSCSQYGSIDEGKTINNDLEFHELMKKVCENCFLDDAILFLDGESKEHTIVGSIEVKGIRGSDRRKYILDLMRLSPRDFNYPDETEQNSCVLRPELLLSYCITQTIESYSEKVKSDPTQYAELQAKLNNKQYLNKLKLNPNLFTKSPLVRNEKTQQQEEDLKKIATFINEKVIPHLVTDLTRVQSDFYKLSDSEKLSEIFHSNGLNIRYIGKVLNKIDQKGFPDTYANILKVLLVKCMKHLFREVMRESSSTNLSKNLSHVFNCVFASRATITQLNSSNMEERPQEEKQAKVQKSKKNKKQKNNGQQSKVTNPESIDKSSTTNPIEIQNSKHINMTPNNFWTYVKEVAKFRYDFVLPETIFDCHQLFWPFFKISVIRDLCRQTGIVLKAQNLNIFEKQDIKSQELPFSVNSIIEIQPNVKHVSFFSEDQKSQLDIANQLFTLNKAEEALELFSSVASITLNLFGSYHKDIALAFSKMANIYFKQKDYEKSIFYQKQAIKILTQTCGKDHILTASNMVNLAFMYFGLKDQQKAVKYALKAFFLYQIVAGEASMDSLAQFENLSIIFQETHDYQKSVNCLFELLDKTTLVYGQDHIRVSNVYQLIAFSHYDQDDIKKSIEFQEKSIQILQKIRLYPKKTKPQQKHRHCYKDSKKVWRIERAFLSRTQKLKKQKMVKNNFQNADRHFGQNKRKKKISAEQQEKQIQKKPNGTESEESIQRKNDDRKALLEKLRLAKLNAKYLSRRQFGYDYNRLVQSQPDQKQ